MHFKLAAAAVFAGVFLFTPRVVEASCCEQMAACCEHAACCDHKDHAMAAEPSAIDMLMAMNPQLAPAPPVRQATEVWFQRPVKVGRSILQGRYVIEHDNDRMARGEPCTHLYAYSDRTKPVATFHCTHLERDRASHNTVALASTSDGMQTLTEFQFAGESVAHGYPSVR